MLHHIVTILVCFLPRSINKHDCDMQHSIIHNKKRHSPVVQTLGTIDEHGQNGENITTGRNHHCDM
jgi:hypothetical protein